MIEINFNGNEKQQLHLHNLVVFRSLFDMTIKCPDEFAYDKL